MRVSKYPVLVALLFSVAASAQPRPYQDELFVTAQPRNPADVARIWALAEHVLQPHDPRMATHELVVSRRTLAQLEADQIPLRVEPLDVQAAVDQSYVSRPRERNETLRGSLGLFGDWFDDVEDLDHINSYLDELAQASNGRAQVIVIGQSIEGRDIKAMRISTRPSAGDRASILVTGTHHAREWITPMVTMGFIDALVRQYDKDPQVKRVEDNVDIYVIPVLNVDGYVATFKGQRLQRKNMHPNCNVDLNRNYDKGFGMGVSRSCSGEDYPGSSPFSEPETQAVKKLIASLSQLRLYMDFHSNAQQIMIPYAYTRNHPSSYAKDKQWAQLYSSTLKTVHGSNLPAEDGYDLAMGSGGGALDWLCSDSTVSLVAELRGGSDAMGFGIPSDGVVPSVEENWVAWLALAQKVADENPAPGGSPDGGTGGNDGGVDGQPDGGVDGGTSGGDRPDAGGAGGGSQGGSGGHSQDGGERPAPPAGGCSYLAASASSPLALFLVLGAAWLLLRRRRGDRARS